MVNIFQDNTKSVPKSSKNIVRVMMTQDELVARKESMPKADSSEANVSHVANRGADAGGE